MNDSPPAVKPNRWGIQIALAIIVLALVPHIGRGAYDIVDGLRVGYYATTNTMSSSTSVMVGYNNYGAGQYGMAVGTSNSLGSAYWNPYASGVVAGGISNTAGGNSSAAFGASNQSIGTQSFSAGYLNTVYGASSAAFGQNNYVNSSTNSATALGKWNVTGANHALATGYYTTALGENSLSAGYYTKAYSYGSVALGRFNAPLSNETETAAKTTWRDGTGSQPVDALFVIGNGTADNARSNALVVKKNGEVDIKKVPAKGGIPMYVP
jgi:hypothetical protein